MKGGLEFVAPGLYVQDQGHRPRSNGKLVFPA